MNDDERLALQLTCPGDGCQGCSGCSSNAEAGTHPEHRAMRERSGHWSVAKPKRCPWGWERWRAQRACRTSGGHWWHPDPGDGMTLWFCCSCGAEREGFPKDGT